MIINLFLNVILWLLWVYTTLPLAVAFSHTALLLVILMIEAEPSESDYD